MSIAMPTVSESAQVLIDARLDTIEQTLFGRMPRSERLTIVREVESQIHELLAERGVEEASREDVLAVLGRLDPPEAYISDEEPVGAERVRRSPVTRPSAVSAPIARGRVDRVAITGGILGLCGLVMLIAVAMMYIVVAGGKLNVGDTLGGILELTVLGTPLLAGAASMSSLIIAAYTRFRSWWSIVGAILSAITLLGTMLYVALIFLG